MGVVFNYGQLIQMVKLDMAVVHLDPGFSGMASLSIINLCILARYDIKAQFFKS
jgi:hypothetical protein